MSTFECSSPYNTEYICNDKLSKCCPPSCYNCCSRYYSNIVMVAGLLMSVFGIVDFFKGGELAIVCPENDALFSSLMLAQGVISMIEGVMIFCSIGRAHGYSLFRSGLPTFQYAFVTYALTAFFYVIALTLSGLQVKATMSHVQRVENSTCAEYFFYIYCRLFINIFVSLSPVILVVTIFALLCCCEIVKGCLTHDSD
nr:uncharacterized protein LOC117681619 [Crassostrea gigas]